MANKKAKKDNKGMIIGVCAAVVVLVIVIVAVVLATGNGGGLSDKYFQSDDSKYVLTLEVGEEEDSEAGVPTLVKIHYVYTYSGDEITGMKLYYEFADANAAKDAVEQVREEGGSMYTDVSVNGKYVVATVAEEQYAGSTASDIKQQIEFMESLKEAAANGTIDEGTDDSEAAEGTEEVVESTEESTEEVTE